jgi:hypothetical protein
VAEVLRAGLDLRDRHAAGVISRHGLAVARGRLENQLSDLVFPPKMNAANERLAQHLWAHRDDLFTFLRQPGLDATNWRAAEAGGPEPGGGGPPARGQQDAEQEHGQAQGGAPVEPGGEAAITQEVAESAVPRKKKLTFDVQPLR